MYEKLVKGADYLNARLLADTWCAAFVWKKDDSDLGKLCPTERSFRSIEDNPHIILPHVKDEVVRLAKHYRFFHWHLAFPDVFRLPEESVDAENQWSGWSGGFDVVLGNPPWVRQELLRPIKQFLATFDSFKSTADSSVFFLERSLFTARRYGRVGLLTPNKWFRANYAGPLRRMLRDNAVIHQLINFGHSRTLFPDADTFPASIVFEPTFSRVSDDTIAHFIRAHDSDREQHGLQLLITGHTVDVPHRNLKTVRWQLESVVESDLLDSLLTRWTPLSAVLERSILSGLKTGYNAAFYIDGQTRNALVECCPEAENVTKRFLRGRDIKRWSPQWDGQWHIVIPSSHNHKWPWSNASSEKDAEEAFAAYLPGIHGHLKTHETQLRERQDQGKYWWELRACDYYDDFENTKVLVQCIAYYSQFALDDSGYYANNKTIVIPTEDPYILAILNSRVTWWIINRTFQHMKDDGLSVDVQFLLGLPIPEVNGGLRSEISSTAKELIAATQHHAEADVHRLELTLNDHILDAFELSEGERQTLTRSLPPRDPVEVL